MKNGIVIPCYNEETRLNLSEIEKYINCNSKQVLCFVNNGSDDNTLSVLKNLQRRLLNSHSSLATQMLIYNLPKHIDRKTAIEEGINHLSENTLVSNIKIEELKFKSFKSIGFDNLVGFTNQAA